jgi:hypothetical protein
MRLTILALAIATLLPATAGARTSPECRRYTRQIEHFAGVVEMAQERGNEMWEQETRRHIERLEARRAERCPEFRPQPSRMAQTAEMLRKASAAATKWFLLQ